VIGAGAAHCDWAISVCGSLTRAVHVDIEPLPLYASELSALAEDDRIELLHVLMLPDLEQADRIGEFWDPDTRA
jgi:hypothetical protein